MPAHRPVILAVSRTVCPAGYHVCSYVCVCLYVFAHMLIRVCVALVIQS